MGREGAENSAKAFREQKLVIFPFLSFLIETVYIPANVGQYNFSVFELLGIQILCCKHKNKNIHKSSYIHRTYGLKRYPNIF